MVKILPRCRTAFSGEALGEDILGWCHEAFGVEVNSFTGKPRPICTSATAPRCVRSDRARWAGPPPVMFPGCWNNPEATRVKFAGDWRLTGDVAVKDGDGYIWYKGGRTT
jgi:acetyl-CoA synthetase